MLALVASEHRRQCLDFLRRCRAPEEGDVQCELTLRTEGGRRGGLAPVARQSSISPHCAHGVVEG